MLPLSMTHAEPLLYATLEPKKIVMGGSARLTITNLGTAARQPPLPVVVGLQFEVVGHTRQFEFSAGNTVPSTSIVVEVRPQLAGTFYIPPVAPGSQPFVLHVLANHGSTASTGPGNTTYMIRPPVQAITPKTAQPGMTEGAAFVRLDLPQRDVYVGESVPVDIVVGVLSGIVTALNGLPTLRGGEFTLNNLSHQPDREERVVDDKRITLFTWHSVLAAVKPGLFHLDVETPLTIKISTRPKQDSAMDALLGDPFLQNYFGASVSKQIKVASPATNFNVLAIPRPGRPADFGGAVGSFRVSSDLTPATSAAGEPLMLRFRVSGTGNFDRVNSEMFLRLRDWKTYPSKASFRASDGIGYRGEKVFEQPLIASQPGAHTVPAMSFSYFDPGTRRFETASSAPLTVTISPAPADAAAIGTAAARPGDRSHLPLRADHAAADQSDSSLVPLYFRAAFLAVPSAATLLLALACLFLRHRGAPLRSRRNSRQMIRLLDRLDAAAKTADAGAFFSAARVILEEVLAERWKISPALITAELVHSRLGVDGDEIGQVFKLADESRYGRPTSDVVDFSRWTQRVRREVTSGAAR